jgi:integrase
MPRLIHALPKLSLHKATGQARVRHRGRDYYLGAYGSQKAKDAYDRLIKELGILPGAEKTEPIPSVLAKETEPALPVNADPLVGEIVPRFMAHARVYYRRANGEPTSEPTTIRHALRPLIKFFAEVPANQFGPRKLKELQERMIELGWSRGTINRAINRVRLCFSWAASEELIRPEVVMGLKTVPGLKKGRTNAREKDPVAPVPDDHLETILPHISSPVADLIGLLRLTGARPSEILTIKADEIDRTTDPECWRYSPGHHKSVHRGKERVIFLGERSQAILTPYLLRAGKGPLFSTTLSALRRMILRACKQAGVPRFAPNQIRHAYATNVRATHGVEAAQVLLGHARADVTQVYAERNERLATAIARKIG